MHSLGSSWVLFFCVAACSEPSGTASGDATPATDAADVQATDSAAGDSASPTDATAPDGDTGAATDVADAGDTAADIDAVDTSRPSATNPEIHCQATADCQPGEVCCTLASSYLSACVAAADCTGGQRDACLVDGQCTARRPGEWTTCCHDRGDRNYCAPSADTCQPLVTCELIADCADEGTDVCCSPHSYYGDSYCTSSFFASLPGHDCP